MRMHGLHEATDGADGGIVDLMAAAIVDTPAAPTGTTYLRLVYYMAYVG